LINGQIPVFATAILSFRFVATHGRELLRLGLLAVPAFLILTFGLDSFSVSPNDSQIAKIGRVAIDFGGRTAIATVVLVAWHRLVMLKLGDVNGSGSIGLGMRELRYFIAWILLSVGFVGVFGAVIALMAAFQFLVMLLLYLVLILAGLADTLVVGQRDQFVVVLWISVFFALPAASYVSGRLSLVLPAMAVDRRRPLRQAWRLSQGNGWRLVVATMFVLVPMESISALCSAASASARYSLAYYPLATLSAISLFLLIVLTGTILSLFSLQLDGALRRDDAFRSAIAIAE
jgi:hypothetical protein